jgi:hypothetical protein
MHPNESIDWHQYGLQTLDPHLFSEAAQFENAKREKRQ